MRVMLGGGIGGKVEKTGTPGGAKGYQQRQLEQSARKTGRTRES